jgi:hypothetical protein
MLTGPTIRISFAILAAVVAASTQAQAHSSSCTPAHLTSALKQVEAECGSAKVISAHRPGARIRGTGHISQHAACDGTHGAIDAVFSNRACALGALRKTNYTIITYGKSAHIHIGTDGWRNGVNTNVARRNTANTRVASQQRAGARYASRQRAGVRTANVQSSVEQNGWNDATWSDSGDIGSAYAQRSGGRSAARQRGARYPSRQRAGVRTANVQSSGEQSGWSDATWSDSGDTGSVYAQRSGGRSAARQRGTRVAARQRSGEQNGWDNATWSDGNWSNGSGADSAYPQRSRGRAASRQRTGVRMASRQGSRNQNGWGNGNGSNGNWSSDH